MAFWSTSTGWSGSGGSLCLGLWRRWRGLLEAGKEIVFVTNNPARAPEAYVERLRGPGLPSATERVVTAGTVTARLAAERAR